MSLLSVITSFFFFFWSWISPSFQIKPGQDTCLIHFMISSTTSCWYCAFNSSFLFCCQHCRDVRACLMSRWMQWLKDELSWNALIWKNARVGITCASYQHQFTSGIKACSIPVTVLQEIICEKYWHVRCFSPVKHESPHQCRYQTGSGKLALMDS